MLCATALRAAAAAAAAAPDEDVAFASSALPLGSLLSSMPAEGERELGPSGEGFVGEYDAEVLLRICGCGWAAWRVGMDGMEDEADEEGGRSGCVEDAESEGARLRKTALALLVLPAVLGPKAVDALWLWLRRRFVPPASLPLLEGCSYIIVLSLFVGRYERAQRAQMCGDGDLLLPFSFYFLVLCCVAREKPCCCVAPVYVSE